MTTTKTVTMKTRTVGQAFGTCAELRDARTGRKLAETRTVPYGFAAAAYDDARSLAAAKGWRIADDDE